MNYTGSIKNRLIGIILLVTILTGVIGYSGFIYWYMKDQYAKTIKLSNTVGLILSQDFAKLILLNDVSAAADITSGLKPFENLKTLVLFKLDEKVIFQYSKDNKTFKPTPLPSEKNRGSSLIQDNIFKLYLDANYQGTKLGYIEFCFKVESIGDILKKHINILLLILFSMIVFSYLLANYFAKRFTSPILKLVNFLEKVDSGEALSKKIETSENNEYGKLYAEVNTMLLRIKSSHDALKLASVAFETQSGIIITDPAHRIIQVNKSFTRITGYEPHEVISKTPTLLKSGLHDSGFYIEMFKRIKEENFWMGEIKNRHKNGQIVNENLTIQAVLDDKGEVIYYVASFLDMTKQKEAEKKLQEKEQMLIHQSKMAAMGEMIGNIAHQWRQPLSIISTISTSLQIQQELNISSFSIEDKEQLKKIDETVSFLSQTIEDFRDFFKPEKEKENFNLSECYIKTINLLHSKFKSLSIDFIEEFDKEIELDNLENELMQVIMNILNNAKDALQNSTSEKKYIFIKIYKEKNNAVISIQDNAGGIPENIIDKIFEPYFTTKHKSQGTGIGLYMSQEMITKHLGGILEVKNILYTYNHIEYKGACFKISLPLKKS